MCFLFDNNVRVWDALKRDNNCEEAVNNHDVVCVEMIERKGNVKALNNIAYKNVLSQLKHHLRTSVKNNTALITHHNMFVLVVAVNAGLNKCKFYEFW